MGRLEEAGSDDQIASDGEVRGATYQNFAEVGDPQSKALNDS